jgi:hypothetical protein
MLLPSFVPPLSSKPYFEKKKIGKSLHAGVFFYTKKIVLT